MSFPKRSPRRTALSAALLCTFVPAVACAATGPSSTDSPYLTPQAAGVDFLSLLTVGDSVRHAHKGNVRYRMTGVPDGLGAFDNGDGTFTLLVDHELGNTVGAVRAHGGRGAFVSKWQVRKSDLKVLAGEDLIAKVNLWNGSGYTATPDVAFNRFCSADLPAATALYNRRTGKGFGEGRLFLNGEETTGGRAFAHVASGRQHGTSYELPALGNAAWENVLASPFEQDLTIVAGMDDGPLNASKLYFYVGHKQAHGNPVQQAGLADGHALQVSIDGFATESGASPIPNAYSGRFSLASIGTGLNRVEDGAWDTVNPNRFYFVTTASFTENSRLWRLTFDDIRNPAAGGKVEVLVDGITAGPKMMDNLTVDDAGNVYVQEDVGNQPHLGRIFKVDPTTGAVTVLAQHDANRFIAGAAMDIDGSDAKQSDEESSGILDITHLFDGLPAYDTAHHRYFVLDVQAHYPSVNGVPLDPALVEGGQLLVMKTDR